MPPIRSYLLIVGVGLVASTLAGTIAYMRMGGFRRRESDYAFAFGCMLIAQYFV